MPKHPNTVQETAQLDTEDWDIAFQPYAEDSDAALTLACNLMIMKAYIAVEPIDADSVIEALDLALQAIYPYTLFHKVSYNTVSQSSGGQNGSGIGRSIKEIGHQILIGLLSKNH